MQVKKTYRLEKSDFVHFGFYSVKKLVAVEVVLMLIISAAAARFILESKYYLLGTVLGFVGAACVIIPINIVTAYRSTVRSYERYAEQFPTVETVIDKRGFTQSTVIGKTTVPFGKLLKVCESKYGIYVYVSSAQAVILSKNHFSEKEWSDIKLLFTKYTDKRRLHFK